MARARKAQSNALDRHEARECPTCLKVFSCLRFSSLMSSFSSCCLFTTLESICPLNALIIFRANVSPDEEFFCERPSNFPGGVSSGPQASMRSPSSASRTLFLARTSTTLDGARPCGQSHAPAVARWCVSYLTLVSHAPGSVLRGDRPWMRCAQGKSHECFFPATQVHCSIAPFPPISA
jgi:hypothetical protein